MHLAHHLKETIITIIPSMASLYAALETTNLLLKVTAGILTIGWLLIRIAMAWNEYQSKKIK